MVFPKYCRCNDEKALSEHSAFVYDVALQRDRMAIIFLPKPRGQIAFDRLTSREPTTVFGFPKVGR